ncbi:MAG: polyhydroxyalkanoic acid synthase [Caulobacterales bacterium]|nr:polyhydroxyalkanoic acid synthase [Caulobacterales bacterium]
MKRTARTALRREPSPSKPAAGIAEAGPAALADAFDQRFKANLARMTSGVSPAGMFAVYANWIAHLTLAPGKRVQLARQAAVSAAALSHYALRAAFDTQIPPLIEPSAGDKRFADEAWRRWPFNVTMQSFLLTQDWWANASSGIDGLAPEDARAVSFLVRQALDRAAPSNFLATNPVILEATIEERGANLARGAQHVAEDASRMLAGDPPVGAERFIVGRDVAVAPGKVVYRNHLIELLQYAPSTATVHAEPVLIVPAWIMKYYVLDLSPHNSLVKHLVDQGHTVFMVSWRNPDEKDRDLGLDDYRSLGIGAALEAVGKLAPGRKVHAAGYCLGGTLLAIEAAAMAGRGDDRLASLSLLAAQTDFTEAGELTLFMRESEVAYLEALMRGQGYLSGRQMAGAFQMLRSNDLVWSRLVHDYMLGRRFEMTDFMAWNADVTRMPARMHAEYLRKLYLNNDLAAGRYMVDGSPVRLADIRIPIFAVGTERDHVAPWRSVYKITFCAAETDVTFLLASGGHNTGIVAAPGDPRASYKVRKTSADERYVDPSAWQEAAPRVEGSWWLQWHSWLAAHSTTRVEAHDRTSLPTSLGDAPGIYVLQR